MKSFVPRSFFSALFAAALALGSASSASAATETIGGVTYSDGRASGGDLKFASIGKFADAIAKNQTAADKYRARLAKYDELAIRNGWTRAYLCRG